MKSLEARWIRLHVGLLLTLLTPLTLIAGGLAHAEGCGEPQRLCAPGAANTSADAGSLPASARAGRREPGPVLLAAADPELAAVAKRAAAAHRADADATPATPAATSAAAAGTQSTGPVRIALLLPLRSSTLTGAAEAVRAGFMAAAERDGAGVKIELVSTGDTPQDALEAYARAAAASDIVVGPLARPAVTALAAGRAGVSLVSKPTIALNYPEGRGPVPRGMLVAGLSVEDEARQIAEWAARAHPRGRALVLTGNAAWAQRAAGAFDARWSELGHTIQRTALPAADGLADPAGIDALRTRLEVDPPDLIFAALDVAELRQVRAATGIAIPCYAGGAANPGRAAGVELGELDGMRVLDLPWIVRPDQADVALYPRPLDSEQPLDMDRLYALGIDAFLIARQLALHPGAPFTIDGVTGQLDGNPETGRLRRREAAVVYHQGVFDPVDQDR